MKVGEIHQDQFQTNIDATLVAACVIIHLLGEALKAAPTQEARPELSMQKTYLRPCQTA